MSSICIYHNLVASGSREGAGIKYGEESILRSTAQSCLNQLLILFRTLCTVTTRGRGRRGERGDIELTSDRSEDTPFQLLLSEAGSNGA